VFPSAIRLLESGLIDLAPIVSDVVPLEETMSAFAAMRRGDAAKIVIRMSDPAG
jgi:threonine dehydrogenase-like Zn-dependent dehydrogenase